MTIIVKPFKSEHLKGMTHSDLSYMPVQEDVIGPAVTFLYHDQPVTCAGIVPLRDGMGEAWFIKHDIEDKPARSALFRAAFPVLRDVIKKHHFHSVQSVVMEGFGVGHRSVKSLSFKEEGIMRRYGPRGENFVWYALILED